MNNKGRKIGSKNKLTNTSKEGLFKVVSNELKRLNKLITTLPIYERFTKLIPYAKLLCVGNDEISYSTRKIIFESLQSEFKKLKFYINHLPKEKRANELRKILMMLSPEQIEKAIDKIE
ncbi:hypothetical protein [Polaribacter porphyrae]|uniref:Uncharacterized protein n=1 Tax=Polaribacter porphyrae TaxID=1137780 RepID=A0A2S7WPP7_9FLAO|nr:hypothetical protein [Polaribacter porphyrae]PQJ79554.1 hypothetical protein BTO18_10390 [Polaribacter porphyrae]